jgi:predicted metalloprotease with PDZ domain
MMTRFFRCVAFRCAAALAMAWCLPIGFSLLADEPPPDAAQPRVEVQLDAEVKEARVRLADEIDKTVELNYLDVAARLVADNALGIDVAPPDAALRAQLGLIKDQGVVVTAVPEESQGASAGVKVHDVLLAIDGQGVGSAAELQKLLAAASGKQVQLLLRRGGKDLELKTTPKKPQLATLLLTDWIDAKTADATLATAERFRLGVQLSEADDTLRAQLGLAAGEGLVVTEVLDGTAAAEAGIRVHDVFTMLDDKRLATVEAINAQIQEIKDESVELRLLRGGKDIALRITPRKTQEAAFSNKPVTLWETNSCKECHQNPHKVDPHSLMGRRLGVNNSVWTDGHHAKLFLYDKAFWGQTEAGQQPADQPPALAQLQSLKSQLAEMQKTLSALESTLQQPPAKEEDRD